MEDSTSSDERSRTLVCARSDEMRRVRGIGNEPSASLGSPNVADDSREVRYCSTSSPIVVRFASSAYNDLTSAKREGTPFDSASVRYRDAFLRNKSPVEEKTASVRACMGSIDHL